MDKRIISGLSWSFAENILTEIVNSIISVVLARKLFPSDYGIVALVQIFINIASIFVNCGLGNALIQKKDLDDEQVSTVFYLNIIIGVILYIMLFTFAPIIANFKERGEIIPVLRVLALKIPISSVYSILHAYIKKRMEFKRFFFSSLIGTLTAGAVGIVMAYRGYGVWSIIASSLIDQIIDCLFLFISLKWIPIFKISISKTKDIIIFGLKLFFTELIARLYSQIRSLLLGIKYSTEDLACDSRGQKMPQSVVSIFNSSIVRVLLPIFSEKQNENDVLRNIARKSLKIYSFVIIPAMIGIYTTSDIFIPLLLTEKWIVCIPYIKIYCIKTIVSTITVFDNNIIESKGAGNEYIKINTIEMIIDILIIVLTITIFDNPLYFAVSSIVSVLISTIVKCRETNKLIGYSFSMHLNDFCPSLLISSFMGLLVFIIGYLNFNKMLLFVIQVVVGITSYIFLSLIFNRKVVDDFLIKIFKPIKDINK